MAMNKKEQQAFDDLQKQLRLAKALRWTEPVQPDVPIPEPFSRKLSKGWLFNSHRSYHNVEPACSSSTSHSMGRDDKTELQGPCRLFSTKLLAMKACRNEMEVRFAETLANFDAQIEEEISKV